MTVCALSAPSRRRLRDSAFRRRGSRWPGCGRQRDDRLGPAAHGRVDHLPRRQPIDAAGRGRDEHFACPRQFVLASAGTRLRSRRAAKGARPPARRSPSSGRAPCPFGARRGRRSQGRPTSSGPAVPRRARPRGAGTRTQSSTAGSRDPRSLARSDSPSPTVVRAGCVGDVEQRLDPAGSLDEGVDRAPADELGDPLDVGGRLDLRDPHADGRVEPGDGREVTGVAGVDPHVDANVARSRANRAIRPSRRGQPTCGPARPRLRGRRSRAACRSPTAFSKRSGRSPGTYSAVTIGARPAGVGFDPEPSRRSGSSGVSLSERVMGRHRSAGGPPSGHPALGCTFPHSGALRHSDLSLVGGRVHTTPLARSSPISVSV